MSKPKIDKHQYDVALRFMHWLAQLIALIKPTNLYVILGRAGAKTVSILSPRFKDISKEMPGAFVSISSDTYMNAIKNVIPNILQGWQLLGWVEGIHYVVDQRPPKHFKKPHKTVLSWKHTITTHHGTHFKIISQDRPSAGAGDSYQADGGDEAKYLNEKKLNKIKQATRGESVKYSKSPYYLGSTYTTDMPNTNLGEHDWILSMEENMDLKQIELIVQVAFVLNDEKIKLVKKQREIKANPANLKLKKQLRNIKKNIERWNERYIKARMDSTFFYIGSSYVNADILTEKYFHTQFEKGNFKELMTALLSIPPQLEKGLMFYPNLTESNFYSDGFTYKRVDQSSYAQIVTEQESCLDLKYLNTNTHLEAGFDSGNMCSLVIGQSSPGLIRGLKEFWTIPEDFIPELGAQFVEYFKYHKRKELLLWHDRATNKWQSVGEDHASKLKKAIEFNADGTPTGWMVSLQSRNQANITHQSEYELMLQMHSGSNPKLPKLLIDKHNCPCWKSSMERTEKIIKTKENGNKSTHKDKSSEKLPFHRLPLESTNMSDAGKYFLCRPEHIREISGKEILFSSDPTIK
ncbi:hypothetical protein [Lacinutrix sp. Hel_I_90]|uniref:hypothetical protein n=1 Tax=Lacinutrix sp. Hel_I_90 TaxID=1249999 RepID=UPI0005C92191|nr:hypothetical protein [Lacinutrix sp. Hel_I_90]